MKRRGLPLSRRHRVIFYTTSLLLFISGAAWALANFFDDTRSEEWPRQWKPCLLKIHGLSAMLFVLLLGTLLTGHVRRAWHWRKNRGNGIFFLTAISLLTLSGYALYYIGNEEFRKATSQFHLWAGLAAPALLVWHIWSGRQATLK